MRFCDLTSIGVGGRIANAVPVSLTAPPESILAQLQRADAIGPGRERLVLGHGSNLVAGDGDHTLPVIVVDAVGDGITLRNETADDLEFEVSAGVRWDRFVEESLRAGCVGLERLSGIPGLVGAAPIQNIGAYGQDVSETLESLVALDLDRGSVVEFAADDCRFAYRTSRFRSEPSRWFIPSVRFRLPLASLTAVPAYPDFLGRFGSQTMVDVAHLRHEVLQIRAEKGLLDWRHSSITGRTAGSFFKAPRVAPGVAEEIVGQVVGPQRVDEFLARYAAGRNKGHIPAAHVLLATGFNNGDRWGRVGLSRNQVIALENLGEASAAEVLGVAQLVKRTVRDRWDIELDVEPVLVGAHVEDFDAAADALQQEYVPASKSKPSWVRSH